jgi:hypothetical protein
VRGHPPQGSGSTSLNCACHPGFPLSEKRVDPWARMAPDDPLWADGPGCPRLAVGVGKLAGQCRAGLRPNVRRCVGPTRARTRWNLKRGGTAADLVQIQAPRTLPAQKSFVRTVQELLLLELPALSLRRAEFKLHLLGKGVIWPVWRNPLFDQLFRWFKRREQLAVSLLLRSNLHAAKLPAK